MHGNIISQYFGRHCCRQRAVLEALNSTFAAGMITLGSWMVQNGYHPFGDDGSGLFSG